MFFIFLMYIRGQYCDLTRRNMEEKKEENEQDKGSPVAIRFARFSM